MKTARCHHGDVANTERDLMVQSRVPDVAAEFATVAFSGWQY